MKKENKFASAQDLDLEEKKLLKSFGKGEWKPVKGLAKEKLQSKKAASKTFRKNVLQECDLILIKD